jgi:hypothetical protein
MEGPINLEELIAAGCRAIHAVPHEVVMVPGDNPRYVNHVREEPDGYLHEILFKNPDGDYFVVARWLDPDNPIEELISLNDEEARLWLRSNRAPAPDHVVQGGRSKLEEELIACPVVLQGEGQPITICDHPGSSRPDRTIDDLRGKVYLLVAALVRHWHEHGQGMTRKELMKDSGMLGVRDVRTAIKRLWKHDSIWQTVLYYQKDRDRGGRGKAGRYWLGWPS